MRPAALRRPLARPASALLPESMAAGVHYEVSQSDTTGTAKERSDEVNSDFMGFAVRAAVPMGLIEDCMLWLLAASPLLALEGTGGVGND